MTTEMLIGGLMILTMVAAIVFVTTSSRDNNRDRFEEGRDSRKGRDSQSS